MGAILTVLYITVRSEVREAREASKANKENKKPGGVTHSAALVVQQTLISPVSSDLLSPPETERPILSECLSLHRPAGRPLVGRYP